jgi:hypothetical protein
VSFPRFADEAGVPITAEMAVGRRCRHYDREAGAWDWEGEIVGVHPLAPHRWLIRKDNCVSEYVSTDDLAIRAYSEDMVKRGADALQAGWHRPGTPEKQEQQRRTAEKHSRAVLSGALMRSG